MTPQVTINEDLIEGAENIVAFMFGDRKSRQAVYALARKTDVPVFKMGRKLFARRSALMAWIETQEQRNRISR